jgi:hypothetical protein
VKSHTSKLLNLLLSKLGLFWVGTICLCDLVLNYYWGRSKQLNGGDEIKVYCVFHLGATGRGAYGCIKFMQTIVYSQNSSFMACSPFMSICIAFIHIRTKIQSITSFINMSRKEQGLKWKTPNLKRQPKNTIQHVIFFNWHCRAMT